MTARKTGKNMCKTIRKKILYGKSKLEKYYEHTDRINTDGKTEVWMKDF
jgi:hypothetical protein